MHFTIIETNLETDQSWAIDKTDQRMRPSALLGQMMWYAIYIIRCTHHSEWEKLIAAEKHQRKTSGSQITMIWDAELWDDTAFPNLLI